MFAPSTVIQVLSFITLLGDIAIVLGILAVCVRFLLKKPCLLTVFISRHGLLLLFLTALTASVGSLYFSEIAQFTPCKACWFQRIFMYVQVPLLLVALIRKDRGIAPYILTLCILGILFSLNQYAEQIQNILLPVLRGVCGDPAVDCSRAEMFKYGYITIPTMAATGFLMNALMSLVVMRRARS
ncbi:MAG: disulfide bond formation protein B [Candidatus Peribacteraceae bacterium]|nr:disulfide bond formation protein B [Candidatus Peribacteraceae bacterium]